MQIPYLCRLLQSECDRYLGALLLAGALNKSPVALAQSQLALLGPVRARSSPPYFQRLFCWVEIGETLSPGGLPSTHLFLTEVCPQDFLTSWKFLYFQNKFQDRVNFPKVIVNVVLVLSHPPDAFLGAWNFSRVWYHRTGQARLYSLSSVTPSYGCFSGLQIKASQEIWWCTNKKLAILHLASECRSLGQCAASHSRFCFSLGQCCASNSYITFFSLRLKVFWFSTTQLRIKMRATLQRTNWFATLSVSKWDLRSRLNFNLDFQFLTESFQQCFKARSSYEGPLQYLSALVLEDTKYPSEILFSKNLKVDMGFISSLYVVQSTRRWKWFAVLAIHLKY